MKKLLAIIVLSFLWSNVSFAHASLKNILNIYASKVAKIDHPQHLFYSNELKVASRKIKAVGLPCFRTIIADIKKYNSDVHCSTFRVLLGEDTDEWIYYLKKLGTIADTYQILLKDDQWVSEWQGKQLDEMVVNIVETTANFSIANEIIELVTKK